MTVLESCFCDTDRVNIDCAFESCLCGVLWLVWMCDECTWHHKTFLVQWCWHLAIKLYWTLTESYPYPADVADTTMIAQTTSEVRVLRPPPPSPRFLRSPSGTSTPSHTCTLARVPVLPAMLMTKQRGPVRHCRCAPPPFVEPTASFWTKNKLTFRVIGPRFVLLIFFSVPLFFLLCWLWLISVAHLIVLKERWLLDFCGRH